MQKKLKTIAGWMVHVYTASSAIFGLLTLSAISQGDFVWAFWWMAVTVFIDSTDGTLARRLEVFRYVPKIDGALLDNLVDYLNYVITPCYFLLHSDLIELAYRWIVAGTVAIASAYQFAQKDAKTNDHFFKGFPCYWNIVLLYLFVWNVGVTINAALLIVLCALVFVPIKYVYPSQMENVSKSWLLRGMLLLATAVFCLSSVYMLWIYPEQNIIALLYSLLFIALYLAVSLYRTFNPLNLVRVTKEKLMNQRVWPTKE